MVFAALSVLMVLVQTPSFMFLRQADGNPNAVLENAVERGVNRVCKKAKPC